MYDRAPQRFARGPHNTSPALEVAQVGTKLNGVMKRLHSFNRLRPTLLH
jgi:hypothetical protein